VTALLDWVAGIDLTTLYALLALVAFIESIFPPAPADVVVAFGAFLAARRGASYPMVVAAIVAGSTVGAMVVYAVARHFGARPVVLALNEGHGTEDGELDVLRPGAGVESQS